MDILSSVLGTSILKTIAVMTFGSVGSLIMLSSAKKSVVNNFQNLISCVKTQNREEFLGKLYHF